MDTSPPDGNYVGIVQSGSLLFMAGQVCVTMDEILMCQGFGRYAPR